MAKIVFLSGAGLSAPSGLSTFRDSNGLWDEYDLNVVCNYNTWIKNYKLVHKFYNKRRMELKKVQANKMHKKIAELSRQYELINFTQNVDDLLERAGCKNVIHLHGELLKLYCFTCKHQKVLNIDEDLEFKFNRCENCASDLIKPSIIFFNEIAPLYEKLYEVFFNLSEKDLVFIVGTSAYVINVNYLLSHSKSTNVLINLEKSKYINEDLFSYIIYKSCDECDVEVEQIIQKWKS